MSLDEAAGLIADFVRQPVDLQSSTPLLDVALRIAAGHATTVYDALYVALALAEGCRLVTADPRLYRALETADPQALLWVEEVPAP